MCYIRLFTLLKAYKFRILGRRQNGLFYFHRLHHNAIPLIVLYLSKAKFKCIFPPQKVGIFTFAVITMASTSFSREKKPMKIRFPLNCVTCIKATQTYTPYN